MKTYIESIDLLRGICIILMIFINFFDEIAKVSILEAKQGLCIDFLITSMVPSVFITLMGFLLILSDGYKAKHIFEKAIKILIIGYLINLIRVPVPQLIGNLLGVTQYGDLLKQVIYHLSMIDIYSFVGYVLLLIIPLTYVRLPYMAYFAISALLMLITSYKQELLGMMPSYLKFVFGYIFIGEPKNVYFPIFPWATYLLLGIGLGLLYLKHGKNVFYKTVAIIGLIGLYIGHVIFRLSYNDHFSMLNNFYKHDYTVGIFLVGLTMLLIFIADKIFYRIPQFFKSCLIFTSKHIIKMYCLSWIFTGWFVTLRGLHNNFSICESIIGAIVIYLLSFMSLVYMEKSNADIRLKG